MGTSQLHIWQFDIPHVVCGESILSRYVGPKLLASFTFAFTLKSNLNKQCLMIFMPTIVNRKATFKLTICMTHDPTFCVGNAFWTIMTPIHRFKDVDSYIRHICLMILYVKHFLSLAFGISAVDGPTLGSMLH